MSLTISEDGPEVESVQLDQTFGELYKSYLGEAQNLMRMFDRIKTYAPERQQVLLGALSRYVEEAKKNSYRAETSALAELMGSQLLNDVASGVELGAGAGDLLRKLARGNPDKRFVGVDLSPGFVTNFQGSRGRLANANMTSGLIDDPQDLALVLQGWGIEPGNSVVSSVLTLDRVGNPNDLLEFMSRFQRALVGVLLPTCPVDDNPSIPDAERRVYTLPKDRIKPGKSRIEDRALLGEYLRTAWGSDTQSTTLPYVVSSSGDRQEYLLDVFYR